MNIVKYRVYPTLLNEFGKYLSSPVSENRQRLINRINRVADFDDVTLAKFKKGIGFEDAVLKNKPHKFEIQIIESVKSMLPSSFVAQKQVKFIHNNIQFYGFADVVGEGRVIDIKTTSSYNYPRFAFNFQNLYLYGLKDLGCTQMDYIIYDFDTIHKETYHISTFDFGLMLHQMELFTEFLEENRKYITDKKIFVTKDDSGWSLF
jgi:hypothetical protein